MRKKKTIVNRYLRTGSSSTSSVNERKIGNGKVFTEIVWKYNANVEDQLPSPHFHWLRPLFEAAKIECDVVLKRNPYALDCIVLDLNSECMCAAHESIYDAFPNCIQSFTSLFCRSLSYFVLISMELKNSIALQEKKSTRMYKIYKSNFKSKRCCSHIL